MSNATTLVGLPVCADGVRFGTVGAVWVDALDQVLGMDVDSAWSADTRYLPYATTTVLNGTITTSSLTVLAIDATTFFAERRAPGHDHGSARFGEDGSRVGTLGGDAGA